jgi:phage-related protein
MEFLKAKGFFTEVVNNVIESAQQAKESVSETASKTVNAVSRVTDNAVNTVESTAQRAADSVETVKGESLNTITAISQQAKASLVETVEQTKTSLEQTLQNAEQLKGGMSNAVRTAVDAFVSEWLHAHPAVFRLIHFLLWVLNHPIISSIALLLVIAIAFSLIKALGRLFEEIGWSLLQSPFKLIRALLQACFQLLSNLGGSCMKQLGIATESPVLLKTPFQRSSKDKKQRLAEISVRLEAIRQEQDELLKEVAAILGKE